MILADLSNYVTMAVGIFGIVGIFIGLYQYREDRVQRRKTTVLELVKEFEDKVELTYAIDCLDEFYVDPEKDWDNQNDRYYGNENLPAILRDHRKQPVTDKGEIAIRKSFDYLLGFFGKVGYLRDIGLIEDKELEFFKYYLKKAADNPAVESYTKVYEVPLYSKLVSYMKEKSLLK
jgi:hypothetical protein